MCRIPDGWQKPQLIYELVTRMDEALRTLCLDISVLDVKCTFVTEQRVTYAGRDLTARLGAG
jgi:hypothetical protein